MPRQLVKNKLAARDYLIMETLEAGLVLTGPEVKAVRLGQVNLRSSYIKVSLDNLVMLANCHISPYLPAGPALTKYLPTRERQLLLRKKEIRYLLGKTREAGISLIPLELYLSNNIIKIKIGVCRGQKKYDKREADKKRDFTRRKNKLLKHY